MRSLLSPFPGESINHCVSINFRGTSWCVPISVVSFEEHTARQVKSAANPGRNKSQLDPDSSWKKRTKAVLQRINHRELMSSLEKRVFRRLSPTTKKKGHGWLVHLEGAFSCFEPPLKFMWNFGLPVTHGSGCCCNGYNREKLPHPGVQTGTRIC